MTSSNPTPVQDPVATPPQEHKFTVELDGQVVDNTKKTEETAPAAPPTPAAPPAPVEPVPTPDPTPAPLEKSVESEAADALYAFQTGESSDPMMEAIQKEIGQSLTPANFNNPDLEAEAYLQPLEADDVFRCMNLTKSYGTGAAYTEVIKGVTFTVKKGEYIVIYGPSGSGKSTLLNLLSGLENPTRGEIRLRNHVIQKLTDEEMAFYHREEVGLVFQNFNLLGSQTVWENIAFPLMLSGAPADWRRHEALKMLERFDMQDFANHYPNQLSGGQQQRVGLARALIHDPEILLIDEPTGNLDSRSADIVIHEIDRLHKQEERTIILVTHSQVFLPFATRVFYIKDGTLLTSNEHDSLNPPQ